MGPLGTCPDVEIQVCRGRSVVFRGGLRQSQAMYHDSWVDVGDRPEADPKRWLDRNRRAMQSGVHNYALGVSHWVHQHSWESRFWQGDGVYPEVSPCDDAFDVERQAEALIEMDPQAVFYIRFSDYVPPAWREANPGEMQWNEALQDKDLEQIVKPLGQPSFASEKALRDTCTFVGRLIRYCEQQPWADRILGYMYFAVGEGVPRLNCSGFLFDHSPAMQTAFRRFIREKYGTEEVLRKAWQADGLTFDSVTVPTDEEWRRERRDLLHWIEGDQLRRWRDYCELQRALFLKWYRTLIRTAVDARGDRKVLFGLDIGKQLFGWAIRLFWDGAGTSADAPDLFSAAGSVDIGELLDEPGLDLIWNPADYHARLVGYGWESEGMVADSMLLRGKAAFLEDDSRTFVPGENHTIGAFRSVQEVRAGLLRNAAWAVTRGHLAWWLPGCHAYFHDDAIHREALQVVRPILDAAPRWPHRETEHAVAMIFDDTSPREEDGTCGYQNLAMLWQRILGLSHCGIPYRIFMLSDLARDNMPDCRCYLFPNLFRVDGERLELLQKKVFRDGKLSIFGPATGISDGARLSAEWAGRLLGVEMELVRCGSARRVILQGPHRVVDALPSSLVYGDSLPYGPILVPCEGAVEAAGGEVLGMATTVWNVNRPGLFVRDASVRGEGDYKLAWTLAVPLPGNLIRELARYGGCHIWCEDDDVLFASETAAAIHSVRSGKRILRFPTPRTVWDLVDGRCRGRDITEVEVAIDPPQTHFFYFGEESPWAL